MGKGCFIAIEYQFDTLVNFGTSSKDLEKNLKRLGVKKLGINEVLLSYEWMRCVFGGYFFILRYPYYLRKLTKLKDRGELVDYVYKHLRDNLKT